MGRPVKSLVRIANMKDKKICKTSPKMNNFLFSCGCLVAVLSPEKKVVTTGMITIIYISAVDLSFHAITKNEPFSDEVCAYLGIAVSIWNHSACDRIR